MFYERALNYIEDVRSGKEQACIYVKQAIKRHLSDVKNATKKGIYFDVNAAKLYLEAVHIFKHTRGSEFAGKPFDLQPFQCFIIYTLFGWKRIENGRRRFKRVYIETAKKSGKSEFAALIMWLCLLIDKDYGAQLYTVATKRDQAMHVFRAAQTMGKFLRQDSHYLRNYISQNKQRTFIEETESFMEPLTSDSQKQDGMDPFVAVIDEYMAHKTSEMSDVCRNAMVARRNSLHFTITTAGFNIQSPCYRVAREELVRVLNGTIVDDSLFGVIYTLDDDDDWNDIKKWRKANPNIGRTVLLENMVDLYNAAKNGGPSREVDFKTKNLNIWCKTQYNWIPDELFMESKMDYSLQKMQDKRVMCWGGMDLGQNRDLTCFACLFDPAANQGKYIFELYTWICQDSLEKKTEQGEPHPQWVQDGWLQITPGNVTDYGYVENFLLDWNSRYQLINTGYDRANSTQTVTNMTNNGMIMEQFSQQILNMNAPTRELERIFYGRLAGHNGNDVMRFMFQNIELIRDSNGNIKVSKKDAEKKVDGVVAMVMALGQYMDWQRLNGSLYKEGFRFL